MQRADYERYATAFNTRDYDAVFDFYADEPDIAFFGIAIRTREELKAFYGFLHAYVRETVTVERFAASDELVAVEGVVRVEGIRDLDAATLAAHGMAELQPIRAGDVQEMRQYIHYHVRDGKFTGVGCAIVG